MPVLPFLDSFDHYGTNDILDKWTTAAVGAGSDFHIVTNGRTGNGAEFGSIGSPMKTFGPEYPTLTCGGAYKCSGLGGNIFTLFNMAATSNNRNILSQLGDGTLTVGHEFGSLAVIPSFTMVTGRFYYFEMQCTDVVVGTTQTSTYEVRADGVVIYTGSAVDVGTRQNRGLANFSLGGPGGGNTAIWDDIYVTETEFLGDIRIGVIRPNGDTADAAWTPSAAVAHYTLIDDITPDYDVTYLEGGAVSDTEKEQMENITSGGTIKAIQAIWFARKTASGVATSEGILDHLGTEDLAPESFASFLSYLYNRVGYRKSPFTGNDWTRAEINALLMGIRRLT